MRKSRHGYRLFLFLGIAGGLVVAATYVWATALSVSPTDLAYKQPIAQTFADPFVLVIAVPFGIFAGVLVSPFAFFCLRDRRVSVAFPIVLVATLLSVVLVTVRFGLLGIPAGFVAVAGSCLISARIRMTEPV